MMTIYSMTGFGRGEEESDKYIVTVEIKSVNHRFKDTRFKMSSLFNSLELDLKKALFNKVKRGSFDIYINFKRAESTSKFDDIDESKVKDFVDKMKSMLSGESLMIKPTDFLRSEFLLEQDLSKDTELSDMVVKAFDKSLDNLMLSRESEGKKLKEVMSKHKSAYEDYYSKIEKLSETFQANVEEKLRKRFEEYKSEMQIDQPRFLQEVVFYLEKLDIHEEINRIQAHLEKLDGIIQGGGEVGRQIDFLIQELNRETNTIGSKSSVKEISDCVVQMKVQLEKIREQGLNLE
ncbi:MAG: YicC family protein [Halobacteriovoraceae bacterium]|nr:YicC family protein [Halobacteriovoraceae bacterium]